jgi:hypothetical protein
MFLVALMLLLLLVPMIGCAEEPVPASSSSTAAVTALQTQVAALTATQTALQTQITALSAKAAPDMSTFVSKAVHDAKIAELEAQVDVTMTKASSQTDTIAALNSKVSALETWKSSFGGSSSNNSGTPGQVTLSILSRYDQPVYPNENTQTFRLELVNSTNTAMWVKVDCDFTTSDGNTQVVTSVELKDDDGTAITVSPVSGTISNFYGRTKAVRVQRNASYEMVVSVKINVSSGSRGWNADFTPKSNDYSW